MLDRLAPLMLTRLLWFLALVIVVLSWVKAVSANDAHWVNRGGALIAALAAGSVLLQIVVEIELERRRVKVESRMAGSIHSPESMSVIERKAMQMEKNKIHQQVEDLEQQRLRVVLNVVVCAMVGELLHGFGDLIICALALHCGH